MRARVVGVRNLQKAWPRAWIGVSGELEAGLFAAPGRSAFGERSERARSGLGQSRTVLGARAHWHGNAEVSQGLNCVAGAALSQGEVQISWQAQHFRKVKFFQGLNCVAGAALSWGRVQISWQAQHFRKIKYRFRGRRSTFERSCTFRDRRNTFARSSTDLAAGAALSQGQVPNSWQAQHFRKVKHRSGGRRSTFARSSAKFVAGTALSQGQVQISWQAQHFR